MKAERNNLPLVSSQTLNSSARRWPWVISIVIILTLIGAVVLQGIRSGNPQPAVAIRQRTAGAQPVPVVTAVAKSGAMKVYLNGLGSIVPYKTITVKSRVAGQLIKVLWQEGQAVCTG